MDKLISDKYGCRIVERNHRLFIQYDSGGSGSLMVESEITEEESVRAMNSADDAYKVILESQKRSDAKRLSK